MLHYLSEFEICSKKIDCDSVLNCCCGVGT